jgi:hypothetical protein
LVEQTDRTGEQIILGDLNLHHPWWGGPGIPTQHDASDIIIELIQERRMELLVPERDPEREISCIGESKRGRNGGNG